MTQLFDPGHIVKGLYVLSQRQLNVCGYCGPIHDSAEAELLQSPGDDECWNVYILEFDQATKNIYRTMDLEMIGLRKTPTAFSHMWIFDFNFYI